MGKFQLTYKLPKLPQEGRELPQSLLKSRDFLIRQSLIEHVSPAPVILLHIIILFLPPQHLLPCGTARAKNRKPEPIPEAFKDHVQIHQVGDDVGLAVIQRLQGLRRENDEHRTAGTGLP